MAACRGAAKESDRAWLGQSGGWIVEEPDGAQRLALPGVDAQGAEDSAVVNVLSALVHGPDPADTRRSKGVKVSPMPVASQRGLGFKLTVRW